MPGLFRTKPLIPLSKAARNRDFDNEISAESSEIIDYKFYDLNLMSNALAPFIK